MEDQVWKPTDLPLYEVSREGKVRNIKTKRELKPQTHPSIGYVYFILRNGKGGYCIKYLHRLLAEAFIPNPLGKPEVNHIDLDRGNYKLENLEWTTSSENKLHAVKNGVGRGRTAFSVEKKLAILTYIEAGVGTKAIRELFNCSKSAVTKLRRANGTARERLSEEGNEEAGRADKERACDILFR